MTTADLGAFRLGERLAQGGMGEVWSAVHRASGLKCAVKLIRPDVMNEQAASDFDGEIRSHARLDHPGIVYLLDHGRVERDAAGPLDTEPGVPWVAMEFCSSSLYAMSADLTWEDLRSVLLQLLDALSHAHAAGVLHRDIKLSNVLVSLAGDLRPGVKLADFGVAHVLADDDETTRNVGTPRYMAPEQVRGEWEMLGPWTDLYALGVLAWRLVTGRVPWARLSGGTLAMAMLEKPLGWSAPRYPVPSGFRDWIERMTCKVPAERFQLAADAAAALRILTEHSIPSEFMLLADPVAGTLIPQDDEAETLPRAPLVDPLEEPPAETEGSIRLHAGGLGLLALRRPPLIGRRAERALAWGMLRRVAQTGRTETLSIEGDLGVGRSRFMAWIGEAAMSTGQGQRVQIDLVPGVDPGDQIVRGLRAWFRIGAMDRWLARAHLETWLGDAPFLDDFAALLVRREASDASWQGLTRKALAALGRRRPVVFTITGAHRHPELEGFLSALGGDGAAVLLVVDRVVPGAERLRLVPLTDASLHRLVAAMVGLEPELRAQLVDRAAGSPRYLVSTLCHWADQGRLVPGEHGFVLCGDEAGAPSLSVVAVGRLGAVYTGLPEEAIASLELAAVLGTRVEREIWRAVDGPDRARLRGRVIECLAARGLMVEEDGVVRFTSVPFRQAVLQGAQARLAGYHRRCAEALAAQATAVAVLARGRHLLAAGDPEASLGPLREGVERVANREGAQAALATLSELDIAVSALIGPQRLRWRAVVDVLRAGFLIEIGQSDLAIEPTDNAMRTGELLSDSDLLARAWACRGAAAARRDEHAVAVRCYREALDLGESIPPAEQGRWWVQLGRAHLARGDRATWSACMSAAAECAAADLAHGSPQLVPLGKAAAAQVAGRFEAALDCLDEAYALAAEMGSGLARLSVLRARAHTLLDAGRTQEAREVLARALELALQVEATRAPTVLANLVALEFRLGETARALDLFDRHQFLLPAGGGDDPELVPLHCVALAVGAARSDWDRVDHHHERVARRGSWRWSVLACNLMSIRIAVQFARADGRGLLARELTSLGLDRAAEAGGTHPDRLALERR